MRKFPQPVPYSRLYVGPLVLTVLVAVAAPLVNARYGYLMQNLQLAGIYSIIIIGLTLLMGFTGQVSLGHAAFFGLGAYAAAIAVASFHAPMWAALAAAVLAGGILAFVSGFWILRLKGLYLALATLCVGIIVEEIIKSLKFAETSTSDIYGLPMLNPFGLLSRGNIAGVYFVWFFVIIAAIWAVHLTESPAGRALRGIHGDEDAAESLGISAFAVKLKVFVISGVLAGFAGFIYAFTYSRDAVTTESLQLSLSITLVTMVVIGGMGSIWGGIAGVLTMLGLREVISVVGQSMHLDTARFEELLFGMILVTIMIFSPNGLIPGLRRGFGRLLKRARARS